MESRSTLTNGRASTPLASTFMAVTMSSDIDAITISGLWSSKSDQVWDGNCSAAGPRGTGQPSLRGAHKWGFPFRSPHGLPVDPWTDVGLRRRSTIHQRLQTLSGRFFRRPGLGPMLDRMQSVTPSRQHLPACPNEHMPPHSKRCRTTQSPFPDLFVMQTVTAHVDDSQAPAHYK